jgi:hypothetical protein
VVWSDRCGVAVGQGGFEFDSEGNLVGVHLFGSACVLDFVMRRIVCVALTHMSHAFGSSSSQEKQLFEGFSHVSERRPRATGFAPVAAWKQALNDADLRTGRDSSRPVATLAKA